MCFPILARSLKEYTFSLLSFLWLEANRLSTSEFDVAIAEEGITPAKDPLESESDPFCLK